jgi:hypothetical protein
MTVVTMKEDDLSFWHAKDFLVHFMRRWKEYHHDNRQFPAAIWPKYIPHIKRFMTANNLKPKEYRDFVDWVFEFAKERHRPYVNFFATVDERLLYLYQRSKQKANKHAVVPATENEIFRLSDIACNDGACFPRKE